VILVKSPMDLIDGAAAWKTADAQGNRVCVITLGGGWGVGHRPVPGVQPDLPPYRRLPGRDE
jgi:hypothetical protein